MKKISLTSFIVYDSTDATFTVYYTKVSSYSILSSLKIQHQYSFDTPFPIAKLQLQFYAMEDIGSEARPLSLGKSDIPTLVRRNEATYNQVTIVNNYSLITCQNLTKQN